MTLRNVNLVSRALTLPFSKGKSPGNEVAWKPSLYFFALEKSARIFLLKEVKPSPDRKMKKKLQTLVHARALLSIKKISYW